MQAKKRAKSVTFGKKKETPEEKVTDKVVEEIISKAAASIESEGPNERVSNPAPHSTLKDEPSVSGAVGSEKSEAASNADDEKEIKEEPKEVTRVEESVVEVISVSKDAEEAEESTSSLEESLKSLHAESEETTPPATKESESAEKTNEPKENWLEASLRHLRSEEKPPLRLEQESEDSAEQEEEKPPTHEQEHHIAVEKKDEHPAPSLSSQQKDFSDQRTESVDESKVSDVPASSFFAEAPKRRNSGKKGGNILFFFGVAFVSFILGLGVMWGVSYGMKNPPSFNFKMDWLTLTKPSPTATPEPTPKPTEEPIDLSVYQIRVLNGSGITGKAAQLKTSLEDAGFTVSATGNADLDDYTKTEIRAKDSVSTAFLKKLETELKKDYVLDSKPGITPTGPDDVVVIIGSETVK